MPRTPTVTVTESGTLELPTSIRRKIPTGTRFAVVMNNGDLVLKHVPAKKTASDDDWSKFDQALATLREWAEREDITVAKLKRAHQQVKRERRQQAASGSG